MFLSTIQKFETALERHWLFGGSKRFAKNAANLPMGLHSSTMNRNDVSACWYAHSLNNEDESRNKVIPVNTLTAQGLRDALSAVPASDRKSFRLSRAHSVLPRPCMQDPSIEHFTNELHWLFLKVEAACLLTGLPTADSDACFLTKYTDSMVLIRQLSRHGQQQVKPHKDFGNGRLTRLCPAIVVSFFSTPPEENEICGLYLQKADKSKLFFNTSGIVIFNAHTVRHGSVPSKKVDRWSLSLYQKRQTQISAFVSRCGTYQPTMSAEEASSVTTQLQAAFQDN